MTDPLVGEIVAALEARARPQRAVGVARETPTAQTCLGLTVGDVREVVRAFTPSFRTLSESDALSAAVAIVDRGYLGGRQCAYELLEKHRAAMAALTSRDVERLGRGIDNWHSVDVFAHSIAGRAWNVGRLADEVVLGWARSSDPWWRRAALASAVSLNMKSRGGSGDAPRTMAVCSLVVDDDHETVHKALSWALRSLVPVDRRVVASFLSEHEGRLPKRVLRETRKKLTTGKKSG